MKLEDFVITKIVSADIYYLKCPKCGYENVPEYAVKICPVCGEKCVKSGKTKAGSQRWLCKSCKSSLTHKINNEAKELQLL